MSTPIRLLRIFIALSLLTSFGVSPSTAAGRTNQTVANTVLNGKGAPGSKLGINGDFYIDVLTFNIYGPKANNRWPNPVSLRGPAGIAGSDGKAGERGNAQTGAQGEQGEKGEKGDAGAAGTQGPQGEKGDAGPKGDPGSAVQFANDVLMTCKSYSFKSNIKANGSTTDKFGRTTRKVTARCGSNQWLLSHSETLQTATPDSQVVSSLVMRDIVRNPITTTEDFTTAADGAAAIPSGASIEFYDSSSSNVLTTRLICCTLDVNVAEGKPTIE